MKATCRQILGAWAMDTPRYRPSATPYYRDTDCTLRQVSQGIHWDSEGWLTCCGRAVDVLWLLGVGKGCDIYRIVKSLRQYLNRTYNPDRGGNGANLSTCRARKPSAIPHRTRAGELILVDSRLQGS